MHLVFAPQGSTSDLTIEIVVIRDPVHNDRAVVGDVYYRLGVLIQKKRPPSWPCHMARYPTPRDHQFWYHTVTAETEPGGDGGGGGAMSPSNADGQPYREEVAIEDSDGIRARQPLMF